MTRSDKLATVCFDEMYTKKKVGWNAKYDMIVGPGKKLQVLTVRSLASSAIKCPLFYDFDRRMVKSLLLEIIYTLESVCGLQILVSICDQAGENRGLQSSLGVTIDDNRFQNPYDPSRKIFFTYDFWHGFKNFR